MKKWLALILTLAVLLSLAACAKQEAPRSTAAEPPVVAEEKPAEPVPAAEPAEPKVVRIGAMDDDGMLSDNARIAQAQGYLEEELGKVGYTPTYISFGWGGTPLAEAMTAGEIDVIMSDSLSQLLLRASGIDVEAIATVNSRVQNGVAVQTDAGIATGADLAGKRVIVPAGSTAELFFNQLLAHYGVDPASVERINTTSDLVTVFSAKEADAVLYGLYTAYYMEAYELGAAIEATYEHPEWTSQSFVAAQQTYWAQNPEAAKAIIRALDRAQAWAEETGKTDPEAVYTMMSKDEMAASINGRIYSYDTSFSYFSPEIGQEGLDKLQVVADYLLDNQLIDEAISISEFVNTDYLDAVRGEG